MIGQGGKSNKLLFTKKKKKNVQKHLTTILMLGSYDFRNQERIILWDLLKLKLNKVLFLT